jgi:cell division protein FtsQ
VGRQLLFVFKLALAAAAIVAAVLAGRAGLEHVIRSPRFALREIAISPTAHAPRDLVLAVAGVSVGDQLLTLDTERIQRRLLRLPWVASVQVRRSLPSTLVIDLTERKAAATALIGGLYLVDEGGHPFKKATSAEAAELVTLTGLGRGLFVAAAEPAEAALRQALELLRAYQTPPQVPFEKGRARPALSEIRIDPRAGFTLVLLQGGTEIALGHGDWPARLARFDLLTETLGPEALAELRQVHLDGPNLSRVPVLPRAPAPEEPEISASTSPQANGGKAARGRDATRAVAMKVPAPGAERAEGKP